MFVREGERQRERERDTDTDTDTEYLFNVVHVKHGTNISSVELLLRQTMVYQQNHR